MTLLVGLVAVALVATVFLGGSAPATGTAVMPTPSSGPTVASPTTPQRSPSSTAGSAATPTPVASAASTATPVPTPSPIYEDLSGIATTADRAHRYPIAVMLDDSPGARPQSGLSAASIVWQAPVEGGIPRYMAFFQAGDPAAIGPVRSARLYFVRWASEWKPLYVHEGGPPPLRSFLNGSQRLVVNADGQRMARVAYRAAPHNLYTDGGKLRRYAAERGADDSHLAYDAGQPGRLQPFRDGASETDRARDGGTIRFTYQTERVDYAYDRASNTWLRSVDGREHHDAVGKAIGGNGAQTSGPRIAPTTVIAMVVRIRRSDRIEGPALGRLEADSIGTGKAWIFADGRIQHATWSKATAHARTRFLDAAGKEIALPRGQLFIQVIPTASALSFKVEPAAE